MGRLAHLYHRLDPAPHLANRLRLRQTHPLPAISRNQKHKKAFIHFIYIYIYPPDIDFQYLLCQFAIDRKWLMVTENVNAEIIRLDIFEDLFERFPKLEIFSFLTI